MAAKNTIFSQKTMLNCNGQLLDLSKPAVMAIINVTPDSFFDGSEIRNEAELLSLAADMIAEGASVLDVGGMSSRPGATIISEEEELSRVIPAVILLKKKFPDIIISVDTWRSNVARQAIHAGAGMINDISAGRFDPKLWETVASFKVAYVLMHMQGTPADMQQNPSYKDVTKEVFEFLKEKIFALNELGIYDVIVDPGFGFGKTTDHNFSLLRQLENFRLFGLPLLAGLSRKSMICKTLKVNPDKALNGTTALNAIALVKGASILRVHDVKEAKETIQLIDALQYAAV